jgi:CRISPR/Cas system-associated exonuclease Cas4 (RecB family)
MEKFFDAMDPTMDLSDMKFVAKNLLVACWNQRRSELESLDVENLDFFLEESKLMIENWVEYFNSELQKDIESGHDTGEAFLRLRPKMEVKYFSNDLKLIGYVDAIIEKDGEVELLDFKTSKTADVDKYKLQIGIYALLYKMEHGKIPDKGALFFFKHGKKNVVVDEELVKEAKKELDDVKAQTQSTEKADYPRCVTPLCKWATGSCDFFEHCFENDAEYEREKN